MTALERAARTRRLVSAPAARLLAAIWAVSACGEATSPTDFEAVIVPDTQAPTAVVEVLDTLGVVIADGRAGFGEPFSLNGARSTDAGGGRIEGYAWSLPDGSVVETTEPRLAVLDVVADPFPLGEHAFGLTVTDDSGNASESVQLVVTVVDVQAPTAVVVVLDTLGALDADGHVRFGDAFVLDGARSTDAGGGRIAGYLWSLSDGSLVETTESRLVVRDVAGDPLTVGRHTFGLTVTDDSGNESVPVQLSVTVLDKQPPTAVARALDATGVVAADGRVAFGSAFSLDASQSMDVGGQISQYDWVLPDGTTVSYPSAVLRVTDIVAPFGVGRYTFGLTVTDDSGNESLPTELSVIVVDAQAPTAVPGVLDSSGAVAADGRVEFGSSFSLDGSQSTDVGGRISRYDWLLPDGTTIAYSSPVLPLTDIVNTPFAVGSHTFGLTVQDDSGNQSIPVQVTVIVVDTQAPTAVVEVTNAAGRPLVGSVRVGSPFFLSGRRSVDAAGQIVRYRWTLPDGTTLTSAAPTLDVTSVVRPGVGVHTFGLTVTDDAGNQSTLTQISVTIVL